MTTQTTLKPLSDGFVRYSLDGTSHLIQTFNSYVSKTTNFERSFFDSGDYKPFFHQMLLAAVFSITKQQWWSREPPMNVYSRSLGDQAVRIVVSTMERFSKRKVHSLTIFLGRVEDKPSKKKFTGMHAKDEHFVDNVKTLLRTLTKEEYEALKAKMLQKENIDLDTVPISCTEYSIHPRSQDDGKLVPVMSSLNSKFEMSVESRKTTVESLRNEPMSTLSEVDFHFSSPIITNNLRSLSSNSFYPMELDNRGPLDQESIIKTIEEFYSLRQEEIPLGEKTYKLAKQGLQESNLELCGFLFGVFGNLKTTVHPFLQNIMVQYNFDSKDKYLFMTFVDRQDFFLKKDAEKPFVIDFSTREPFGFLKYSFLKQIHNHLTPTIRVMRVTVDPSMDDAIVNSKLRLVKTPLSLNLFDFLNRYSLRNSDDYALNIEKAIRALVHSISPSIDVKDKKLEYISAYLYGLLKTDTPKLNTVIKAGLQRNAVLENRQLVNFLLKTEDGKSILISFSNVESSHDQSDISNMEDGSVVHVKVTRNRKQASTFDFDLTVSEVPLNIVETYDFRTVQPVETVESFHKGYSKNYVYLNAIHPAQLIGYFNPLQSQVAESEFDEYDNEVQQRNEPEAKKLKNSPPSERPSISQKLRALFEGAEHVVKNRLSFAAMIDGMFVGIPKLKNKFSKDQSTNSLQRQLTMASFSQESNGNLFLEATNIKFDILDDNPIVEPTSPQDSPVLLTVPSTSNRDTSPGGSSSSGISPGSSGSRSGASPHSGRVSPSILRLINMEEVTSNWDYHRQIAAIRASGVARRLTFETTVESDDPAFSEWRDPNEREPSPEEEFAIPDVIEDKNPVGLALENLELLTERTKKMRRYGSSNIEVHNGNIISFVLDTRESSEERITIASDNEEFITENVKQFCSRGNKRRLKRTSLSRILCPQGKKVSDFEEKVELDDKLLEIKNVDEKLVRSTKKLAKLCSTIQTWMIGRDLSADMINGDWTGLAKDGAFLGGMIASEKFGTLLVEKSISYLKLSKTMENTLLHALTPCVPKLGFDSFIGYSMYEAIHRNGTVEAALDGAVLGADAAECVAEALMAFDIIAATPIVGQIALGVVTLALVAANIHDSYARVESIKNLIPLRDDEDSSEFWRALFHIHSEPLITLLENEKEANKRIIESVMEKNLSSRWFVTPSGKPIRQDKNKILVDYQLNNIVNLTHKIRRLAATRALPDDTKNYSLLCKMAEELEKVEEGFWDRFFAFFHSAYEHVKHYFESDSNESTTVEDYFCVNAFAIEINANKFTSNEALYATHNGNDVIAGYPSADNVFLIGEGRKLIQGGEKKDTFVILGQNISGTLSGHGGYNVLDFSSNAANGEAFFDGDIVDHLDIGVSDIHLYVNNITEIRGRREQPDFVRLDDCTTQVIDLKGGDDEIVIPKMNCSSNLTVYLNDNVYIYQENEQGAFNYIIQDMSGIKFIIIRPESRVKVIFNSLVSFNSQISYVNDEMTISNVDNTKPDSVKIRGVGENLTVHFEEHALLTFYKKHPKLLVNSTDRLNDILTRYADFLDRSAVSLTAHSVSGGETAIINQGQLTVSDDKSGKNVSWYRITRNEVQHSSHLFADKNNSNIFLIKANSDLVVPKVTIYDSYSVPNSTLLNMIDLRILAGQVSRIGYLGLKVKLDHERHGKQCQHISLLLYAFGARRQYYKFLGEIEIHNGFSENLYQKFLVINGGENLFVPSRRPCHLKLTPRPVVMPDKDLVVIFPGQLVENSVLIFKNPVEKVRIFRANNSLVITNLLSVYEKTSVDPLTVVFINFYEYQWFFGSISVNFGFVSGLELGKISTTRNDVSSIGHLWNLISKIVTSLDKPKWKAS